MDVYEPREDSELLEAVVREHARGVCIDIGTGTGIQAFAALENPNVTRVVAVDINPAAVARVEARLGWPQGLCDCAGCWDRTVGASLGECDGRRCEACDGSGLVWKGSEAA